MTAPSKSTTRKSAAKPAAKKPAAKSTAAKSAAAKIAAPPAKPASEQRAAKLARDAAKETNVKLHGEYAVVQRGDQFVVTLKNGGGKTHDVYSAKNANYTALICRALQTGLASTVQNIRKIK